MEERGKWSLGGNVYRGLSDREAPVPEALSSLTGLERSRCAQLRDDKCCCIPYGGGGARTLNWLKTLALTVNSQELSHLGIL